MSEEEKYALIENYLKGDFSEGEKRSFEKLLDTDSELAKKYRIYKLADELVIEHRLLSVKNILQEEKNNGGGKSTIRIIISSLAVLAVLSFIYFIWDNKKGDKEIGKNDIVVLGDQPKVNSNQNDQNKSRGISNLTKKETLLPNTKNSVVSTTEFNQIIELEKKEDEVVNVPITSIKQGQLEESTLRSENKIAKDVSCSAIIIDAQFSTSASCKDESNGSISFRDIKGGNAPYSINIKNKENEDVPSLNIPAGNYTAIINDKRGCLKTINSIVVPEKDCEKEYTFNPFLEEAFILPSQSQHTILAVYERSGNLYFTKEYEPSEQIHWNGYSKNGELNAGYFIFVLSKKDGKEVRGGITIVR